MTLLSHFVTDRRRFGLTPAALVERAARAARDGVTVIQVRERDLPDRELEALVRRVIDAVHGTSTIVLVNDRPDVAIAAGAAGVHLRGDSAAGRRVREMTPPGFVVGRSVHELGEVDAATVEGVYDYLLFGTVFPSAGKPADHRVAGLDALREVCRRSAVPVIAIGGIDRSRVPLVAQAGAAGFAAVGLFM